KRARFRLRILAMARMVRILVPAGLPQAGLARMVRELKHAKFQLCIPLQPAPTGLQPAPAPPPQTPARQRTQQQPQNRQQKFSAMAMSLAAARSATTQAATVWTAS